MALVLKGSAADLSTKSVEQGRPGEQGREFRAIANALVELDTDLFNELHWREAFSEKARQAIAHQEECEAKADEVIEMCGSEVIELEKLRTWARENGELSPWVLFNIVDKVRALTLSESQRVRAKRKNAAPRAWVVEQWTSRTDRDQSRASFARAYAALVKRQFPGADAVTSRTIETRWLKGL